MKILFYQDLPSINSTLLTWTLAEELRLRGHHVDYGKPEYRHARKYDWVHGAGTDCWPALNFARKIQARCHIHLEGVAYWRIGVENAIDWGLDRNHTPDEIAKWRVRYGKWMSAAFSADSCSVNGIKQVETIEKMFGHKLPNCHTVCCGADARLALTLADIPKKNYMITVSRIAANKKVFMIAKALALLSDRGVKLPPWMIVGNGSKEDWQTIVEIIRGKGIKLLIEPVHGAAKWLKIKQAKLMLCGWMGIPPAEGILCKVPVLSFDHIDTLRKFEDTIWYANNNDIKWYAGMVECLLDIKAASKKYPDRFSDIDIIEKTKYAFDRLVNRTTKNQTGGESGELYACTQQQAAEQHERIFIEGMKK